MMFNAWSSVLDTVLNTKRMGTGISIINNALPPKNMKQNMVNTSVPPINAAKGINGIPIIIADRDKAP